MVSRTERMDNKFSAKEHVVQTTRFHSRMPWRCGRVTPETSALRAPSSHGLRPRQPLTRPRPAMVSGITRPHLSFHRLGPSHPSPHLFSPRPRSSLTTPSTPRISVQLKAASGTNGVSEAVWYRWSPYQVPSQSAFVPLGGVYTVPNGFAEAFCAPAPPCFRYGSASGAASEICKRGGRWEFTT